MHRLLAGRKKAAKGSTEGSDSNAFHNPPPEGSSPGPAAQNSLPAGGTFQTLPQPSLGQMQIQAQQSTKPGRRQLGLIPKYPLSDQSQTSVNFRTPSGAVKPNRIAVDIVAIHGLGATGETWVWKKEGQRCDWLGDLDMLPFYVPNSRIFFFEWNANFEENARTDILLGHADDLLQDLHAVRNPIAHADGATQEYNERPIIFLASCFGGLLLIKALHRAAERNSKYKNILDKTVGVSFIGVPFQGSHSTLYNTCHLRVSLALQMGAEANGYLVQYLVQKNNELDEMVQRFCEMADYDELKFTIICFYETHRANYRDAMTKVAETVGKQAGQLRPDNPSKKIKFPQELRKALQEAVDGDLTMVVVDRQSACLQGRERFALDVPHSEMKRFPGPDDANFQKMAYQVRQLADAADQVLSKKG